jgi:hypothetical protein
MLTRRGEKFVQYNPPLFTPVPQIRWDAWGGIEEGNGVSVQLLDNLNPSRLPLCVAHRNGIHSLHPSSIP